MPVPSTSFRKLSSLWLAAFVLLSSSLAEARVRAFLLSGQSNMSGFALVSEAVIPARIPSVAIWNATGGRNGEWSPLGPGFGWDTACFGPEVTLGSALSEAFPDDTISLIKAAVPGTSLAVDWLPPSAGGPGFRYGQLEDWLENAYRDWTVGTLPPLEGVFWMQGESDGTDSVWALAYQERLRALITDVRGARGDSLLPWVVGLIDSQASWPHCGTIRFAQRNIAASLPKVGLVETKGLPTDNVHYRAEGQLELGRRMAWRWLVLNGYREDTATAVDTTGKDSTGVDTTSADTTGKDSTGVDTTSADTTGKDSTGIDTTSADTTGKDSTGVDTTSADTTGGHHIPVSSPERGKAISPFQPGTRLQWMHPDGRGRVEWTQGRGPAPDPRKFRGGMGILVAWFPDGHREIHRMPPTWEP